MGPVELRAANPLGEHESAPPLGSIPSPVSTHRAMAVAGLPVLQSRGVNLPFADSACVLDDLPKSVRNLIPLRASSRDHARYRAAVTLVFGRNVEAFLHRAIRAGGGGNAERFEAEKLENRVFLESDLGRQRDGGHAGKQGEKHRMEATGNDHPAGSVDPRQLVGIEITVEKTPRIELELVGEIEADCPIFVRLQHDDHLAYDP